jgi:hypothetical protein
MAEDETGNKIGPGIYFARIETGGFTDTKKMIRQQQQSASRQVRIIPNA